MRASQPEPLPSLGMRVLELWRYPIKSIGGERLDVAEVAEFGIVGDRTIHILGVVGDRIIQIGLKRRLNW